MPNNQDIIQAIKGDTKITDISPMEKFFMAILKKGQEYGIGGDALKLYNSKVQDQDKNTISEKDFTPSNLQYLKNIVQRKAKDIGPKGQVDYKDYAKYLMEPGIEQVNKDIINSLGGFNYNINPDKSIDINDKYDFNVAKGIPGENDENNSEILKIFDIISPARTASRLGRKLLPDTGGQGVPVKIRLK